MVVEDDSMKPTLAAADEDSIKPSADTDSTQMVADTDSTTKLSAGAESTQMTGLSRNISDTQMTGLNRNISDSDSRFTLNRSQSAVSSLNRSISNGLVPNSQSQTTFSTSVDSMHSVPSVVSKGSIESSAAKSASSKKVKILVASKSVAKLKAVRLGLEEVLTRCAGSVNPPAKMEDIEICPVGGLSSGVSDQPMSDEETLEGARNRLLQIDDDMMKKENADFAVAIEGGLEPDSLCDECLNCFAWILVKGRNDSDIVSKSRTATFMIPTLVRDAIFFKEEELGVAQDRYFSQFGREDLGLGKGEGGTIGPLTFGAISRAQYYAPAVSFAFIPFFNQKRKFDENVPKNPLAFSCNNKRGRDMSAPPGVAAKRQRSTASAPSR